MRLVGSSLEQNGQVRTKTHLYDYRVNRDRSCRIFPSLTVWYSLLRMNSNNFRTSVFIAARFFLSTIVIVPVVSVINKLLNGTWYANWRLALSVS